MSRPAVLEMRLVVTTDDFDRALAFYRDAVGLEQEALYRTSEGSVALLAAGRATLEISDSRNAAFVDRVEVGRRVAGPQRVALRVEDAAATTARLEASGAQVLGAPRLTPFGSINARVAVPELQLTLFQLERQESWTTRE